MKIITQILAVIILSSAAFARALATPHLDVSAQHLGGGLVQYTLAGINDLGGALAIQMTASGNINQIDTDEVGFDPDGPGPLPPTILLPAGPVDRFSQTALAVSTATYQAGGGTPADSWWDDSVLSVPLPPFSTISADGVAGGNVGSTQFSYSAGSPGLSDIASAIIGQIVISDPAAASFGVGPLNVVPIPGVAQLDIIDLVDVGPMFLDAPSLIAAAGNAFSITGTFSVAGNMRPVAINFPESGEIDVDASLGEILDATFGFHSPEPDDTVTITTIQDLDGAVTEGLTISTVSVIPSLVAATLQWAPGPGLIGNSYDLVFDAEDSFGLSTSEPLRINIIPEPSTLTLAGLGLIGLFTYGWRRRRRS